MRLRAPSGSAAIGRLCLPETVARVGACVRELTDWESATAFIGSVGRSAMTCLGSCARVPCSPFRRSTTRFAGSKSGARWLAEFPCSLLTCRAFRSRCEMTTAVCSRRRATWIRGSRFSARRAVHLRRASAGGFEGARWRKRASLGSTLPSSLKRSWPKPASSKCFKPPKPKRVRIPPRSTGRPDYWGQLSASCVLARVTQLPS